MHQIEMLVLDAAWQGDEKRSAEILDRHRSTFLGSIDIGREREQCFGPMSFSECYLDVGLDNIFRIVGR